MNLVTAYIRSRTISFYWIVQIDFLYQFQNVNEILFISLNMLSPKKMLGKRIIVYYDFINFFSLLFVFNFNMKWKKLKKKQNGFGNLYGDGIHVVRII